MVDDDRWGGYNQEPMFSAGVTKFMSKSSKSSKIRGVVRAEEVGGRLDRRDVRPMGVRFRDWVDSGQALIGVLVLALGTMLFFPAMIEVVALLALAFFGWSEKQKFSLSFRMPITARTLDPNDFKPGGVEPAVARGIAFLGNEMDTRRELWFNKSDMCTHILVFGSTGAGKALQDDEPVLTPQGWTAIKNLKAGDQVVTPDRQTAHVTEVFPQGEQPLWKIEFDDGRSIEVTPDHLWGVAVINDSDALKIGVTQPLAVEKVISTDEIEQTLFSREGLLARQSLAIPLTEAVGDGVTVWTMTGDDLAAAARRALDNSDAGFPAEWVEGSVRQRQATWAVLKRMAADTVGPDSLFESDNGGALLAIRKLAWSLGYWAKLDGRSLLVNTSKRWLAIRKITPAHRSAACRCIKISDPQGLFITRDWLVTHNTETLISLAFNALATGSGFIYVDGKGDNGLWAKIFSVVRYLGREDDLLIINYMTGGRDLIGPQDVKPSNTMNPFITGSAAGLTELIVGLMDEAGGDGGMWKGRAISLISAIMLSLVYLRDNDGLLLDVDVIRDYLVLENIQKLSKRRDFPPHILQSLKAYLRSLPGYQENAPKQSETVLDQHGFLQMQFTRIMGSLADTYGHIFRTNLGEVDFFDVVLNRRILVVLLPAMEKSTEELSNLGKIIVACLKQMMATGLGDVLEGSYEDVIETKPTTSPSPFTCILDEYGYYVVKGASVMPAQARSLGFCMVFAGQDYPAFQKNNNKEEAISTIGNCNIKIFMKLEDPGDTYDLAEKSIGKASVGRTSGFALKQGAVNTYGDQQNASVDRRERADWLDFKDHGEGEAHIIFKSTLVRADMFFANPRKINKLQLNAMLRVEPPSSAEMQEWDDGVAEFTEKLSNALMLKDLEEDTRSNTPARLAMICKTFSEAKDGDGARTGLAAMAAIWNMAKDAPQNMADRTKQVSLEALGETVDGRALDIFRDDLDDEDSEDDKDEGWADDERDGEDDGDNDNVFLSEDAFKSDIQRINESLGMGSGEAGERSETIAADMRVVSTYPKVSPPAIEADEYADFLEELESHIDPQKRED